MLGLVGRIVSSLFRAQALLRLDQVPGLLPHWGRWEKKQAAPRMVSASTFSILYLVSLFFFFNSKKYNSNKSSHKSRKWSFLSANRAPYPLVFGACPSTPPSAHTPAVCLGMANPTPGHFFASGTLLWSEPTGLPPTLLGGQPLCGCEFSCSSLTSAHS